MKKVSIWENQKQKHTRKQRQKTTIGSQGEKTIMKKILATLSAAALLAAGNAHGQLILTGVIDGPLSGGVPKAIELYAVSGIADLSLWAVGSANNGGGTDGPEFTLSGTATAGQFLYVASESTGFNSFFGFNPTFTSGSASINGDDAIELFFDATGAFEGSETVHDVFGLISGAPGDTTPSWNYADGWAYRVDNTGPDGSTFTVANWTFSGADALDGETTNAGATTPFPIGTYVIPEPSTAAFLLAGLAAMGLARRRR